MTLIYISYPVIVLSAACIGYGVLAMTLLFRSFTTLPIAFRLTAAYFLGQGLLAGLFALLALRGVFTFPVVLSLIVPGVIFCAASCWRYRRELRSACAEGARAWLRSPVSWRVVAALAAGLYLYGFSTMGRPVIETDASAFYLAAAKLIAHTGQIGTLPGYEYFSWVIMTGELLYASLMLLGSPGVGARFYEWVNFLPTLLALYWVARNCNLSARAAFLAGVMALTSSAAVVLWGGGKTDTFAVGPALIGTWFALASWRPEQRQSCVALSGLFCGFAIAAKTSYMVALLPGVMLLIHWPNIDGAIDEIRALAWKNLLLRSRQVAFVSLWFLGLTAVGLSPFLIKNLVIFDAPFGPGPALASSKWYSTHTVVRLILSYPFALTYGRYWGQLGTLSPLILAFVPLFFLMPRSERKLSSPLTAVTVSTTVAVGIWMVLLPSIFMPRYLLATLLLFGIPAAAGAAYVSRQRTILAGTVVLATAIVVVFMPSHVMTRAQIFNPGRAIDYFLDGDEKRVFASDPTVPTTFEVNRVAGPHDRVLLLIYPRLWLRGDLLATTSTTAEVTEATRLLDKRSETFWAFLHEKKFSFLIVDAAQLDKIMALTKAKPEGIGFCEISSKAGIFAFQIGESCSACPSGDRTVLSGPFAKPWTDGDAYVANIPGLEATSDSPGSPDRSTIAFCEGERRLLPSHGIHAEIRTAGNGRFSHWGKQLYFSTSDNSDPNTNGRTYSVVQPR